MQSFPKLRDIFSKLAALFAVGRAIAVPLRRIAIYSAIAGSASLSGCQEGIDSMFAKAEKPIPARLIKRIDAKDMKPSSPILVRIFKTENVMEVWKQKRNGRYDLLETYEICKWSGKLGPKFKEGDRQAPEGFYTVGRGQMNPKSSYYLSFNMGYPNSYDRSHGRTGTHLMVHGACSSAGCYSMTDEQVGEIYALAREAFNGGQRDFQVQAYPFRMTADNMAKNIADPNFEFWKMLKEGYDHFEITKYPPKVNVCEKRYVFNRVAEDESEFSARAECPTVTMPQSLILAYSDRLEKEQEIFKEVLSRQKVKAKLTGKELVIPPENTTLVAKGSEIMPLPTPKPQPEPEAIPVPQSTPSAVAENLQIPTGAETTIASRAASQTLPGVSIAQSSVNLLDGTPIVQPLTRSSGSNPEQNVQTAKASETKTNWPVLPIGEGVPIPMSAVQNF